MATSADGAVLALRRWLELAGAAPCAGHDGLSVPCTVGKDQSTGAPGAVHSAMLAACQLQLAAGMGRTFTKASTYPWLTSRRH